MQLTGLDHLALTVRDLDASIAFYQGTLGMSHDVFTPTDGSQRHALMFGSQKINLHVAGQEFDPKSLHPTPGSADLCFLSDHDANAWRAHLLAHGQTIEEGPVRRSGAQGPILSIYVRDPTKT